MPIPSQSLTRTAKAAVVHQVIDITPLALSPSREARAAGPWRNASPKLKIGIAAGAGAFFAVIVTVLACMHAGPGQKYPAPTVAAAPAPAVQPAPFVTKAPAVRHAVVEIKAPEPKTMSLLAAIQTGLVECSWRGNGKDRVVMDARNSSDQSLRLTLPAGQLLASADSTVVTVRARTLEFAPRVGMRQQFSTVATSSANKVGEAEFHLSSGPLPELDKLFAYVAGHPEASAGTIQTVVLILTENLPLSSFAKFNELTAGVALLPDTKDFKADTVEILSALNVIKEMGVERSLAVTIDPQLEIESMIDPQAHSLALKYYGIADEWAYWKHELLSGDPSTRHYALYGIARFYPDVAVQMLPKWARQESMSPVYRLSAVQALAQTDKAEAIPILRSLEHEFGGTTELGRAAHLAANFLDDQFARSTKVAAALTTTPAARGTQGSGIASAGN